MRKQINNRRIEDFKNKKKTSNNEIIILKSHAENHCKKIV